MERRETPGIARKKHQAPAERQHGDWHKQDSDCPAAVPQGLGRLL
ncbi:MAG: hypothetical protein P8O22_10630 [Akkermansiaceae bacterium]|nr:hypothetical protein [Akkermansiaceae bacterium]